MQQLTDKFAFKYYAFVPFYAIVAYIIWNYNDSFLALFFVFFQFYVGTQFFNDSKNENKSTQYNKNVFHVGPLLLSCFLTPVMYWIFWTKYDEIATSPLPWLVSIIALSFTIGGSFDASHELIHRNEKFCRIVGYLNLWFHQFTVYPIEHLYLHHKKVGSAEDPITSPKNMSLYQYYVRAIISAYKFNYKYSKKIFALCVFATVSYIITMIFLVLREESGLGKALFFILASYSTIFVLQGIQYIEHYGLIHRKTKETPIQEVCSWNSNENGYFNLVVFRFQRHSDHHLNAYKIYTSLELNEKMPMFPFDFMTGMRVALTPSLWYELMNPLVDEQIEGKPVSKEHKEKIKRITTQLRLVPLVVFAVYLVIKILFL